MEEMKNGMISEEALEEVVGGLKDLKVTREGLTKEKLTKALITSLKVAGVGIAAVGGIGGAGLLGYGIKKAYDKKNSPDDEPRENKEGIVVGYDAPEFGKGGSFGMDKLFGDAPYDE